MDNYTHSETWLELNTPDVENATAHLRFNGIDTCDKLEQLPENMYRIMDPAGPVLIVKKSDEQ